MTKEQKYNKSLLILCLVFFVIYSFTTISVWIPHWLDFRHLIFNWPDANANYFFAQLFANEGRLLWHEPLNLLTDNLLHTRSINVIDGNLVPITFLPGIIIFGLFFKLLGSVGILFLTPALAAISGWLVYRLVEHIFSDIDLAWLTAVLFLSLAPWIFFANVVMLPTVLFIFLVLSGWLAITKSFEQDKHGWRWILGASLLSLALIVRPTEMIWLLLIRIFILYINRAKIALRRFILGVLILITLVFVFLLLNKLTYGGYLSLGYFNLQSDSVSPEFSQSGPWVLFNSIKLFLFPFGFNLWLISKNFYRYFIEIVPLHFFLAIGGVVWLYSKKQINFIWQKYLFLTPVIFFLILFYYGSWDLADPLVKELNHISSSYVRYFMPLYIWILPLTSLALIKIFKQAKNKKLYYLILGFIIVVGFKIAFYSEHDGLVKNRQTLNNYYNQYHLVSMEVSDDAIIVTDRTDKIFFPKYRVIAPQGDLPLWSRVAEIIVGNNIYYYTDKSNEELVIDQKAANQVNLILTEPKEIWSNFRLFKVINE